MSALSFETGDTLINQLDVEIVRDVANSLNRLSQEIQDLIGRFKSR